MILGLGNDLKNVTIEKLIQTHKTCESTVLPKFQGRLEHESQIIHDHFRTQFNSEINQVLREYEKIISTARVQALLISRAW